MQHASAEYRLSTSRNACRPLTLHSCSTRHWASPCGWPHARRSILTACTSQQRHATRVPERLIAAASLSTAAAWGAHRPPPSQLHCTSPTNRTGRLLVVNGIGRGAKGQGDSTADAPKPRQRPQQQRQQQQQQPLSNRKRHQQRSNGTAPHAAPSSKVSPARLTALIKQQTSLADLQDLLQHNSRVLDAIHVNAALQWLVVHESAQPRSPEQLAALVQQWMGRVAVDQQTARNCANLAYYCSKLGYVEDLDLYRDLLHRFMVVKGDANPQNVSNPLYALGSQGQLRGLLGQDVLMGLLQQLQQTVELKPQDVSNALWAAAKVESGDRPQLREVVTQLLSGFMRTVSSATPQAVANTLYALALLPRAWPMDSALQLVERLVQLLPGATPQAVSNALWALGQYAEQGWLLNLPKQSMARVMAAATELLTQLSPGATQGRPGGSRPVVNGQDLSNACWGVAKLQQLGDAPPGQHQPWQAPFSNAAHDVVHVLPLATSQTVSNTLWACAAVRHYPRRLLQDLTGLMPKVQQANTQDVANLAWALAVLAPDPPPAALMASLLQQMQDLLARQPAAATSQALVNTAWAAAVLDQQQLAGQLAPLAAAAFSQQLWPTSQAEEQYQWHQVHLWLIDTQVLGPAGLGAVPGVTQQQLEQCRAAWEEGLATGYGASDVQKEVAKVLSSIPGVEVVGLEQRDQHDGSRSIDIVARYKGQLLAVEVDGPTHFTWLGERPTGETLARNRALVARGYRVVSVPVDPGWRQQRGQQQQQSFLQGLLDGQPARSTSTPTSMATTTASTAMSAPAPTRGTGTAVAGGPGLLARPQRPQPTAGPGRPAKRKSTQTRS